MNEKKTWTHAEWLMPDGKQASGSFEADVDTVLKMIKSLGGTEIKIAYPVGDGFMVPGSSNWWLTVKPDEGTVER